jgi:hypothetical protein
LTREQFEIAFEAAMTPPAPSLPLAVLNGCWLPRELTQRWLESHGYRWPEHFEPAQRLVPHPAVVVEPVEKGSNKTHAGKLRFAPPSRALPFWPAAHDAIYEWLTEYGCPADGDGNQAVLERWLAKWLEDHGHNAGEATVRRHVTRCIKARRDELNA